MGYQYTKNRTCGPSDSWDIATSGLTHLVPLGPLTFDQFKNKERIRVCRGISNILRPNMIYFGQDLTIFILICILLKNPYSNLKIKSIFMFVVEFPTIWDQTWHTLDKIWPFLCCEITKQIVFKKAPGHLNE
jgi:hypothetical protein